MLLSSSSTLECEVVIWLNYNLHKSRNLERLMFPRFSVIELEINRKEG
jgi:hypothetical protein